MNKDDLLRNIAETAYNVGFGAKKHFATYDIVDKIPGVIGFLSITVGIFALFIDSLATKHFSAAFTVFGVVGICISNYDHKKDEYVKVGNELTVLFNRLKKLYFNVKSSGQVDLEEFINELENIESDYIGMSISNQIICSDWYAHYKFFWQQQIDWINEQKHFRFFRDMIPLSFVAVIVLTVSISILIIAFG